MSEVLKIKIAQTRQIEGLAPTPAQISRQKRSRYSPHATCLNGKRGKVRQKCAQKRESLHTLQKFLLRPKRKSNVYAEKGKIIEKKIRKTN